MAKKVICLGKSSSSGYDNYNFVMWYPITTGALPRTAGSLWSGASTAESTAIQNGSVLEEEESYQVPAGIAPTTIKDIALCRWAVRNSQLNGIGPAQYNGVFDDSVTGWSA